MDRKTFGYQEAFSLTALLERGIGDGRIFMPIDWGFRGFRVLVTDGSGTNTEPPISTFHPSPPQVFNDPNRYVRLFAGTIVGDKRIFEARDFFPHTGMYAIRVSYISPVPRNFTSIGDALVAEDGVFAATPISVDVTT